jgi:pilus assembly protein Flp/PilA
MNTLIAYLYVRLRNFVEREEGQDLVEYSMVVALIALGATTGMAYVSSAVNTVFVTVATILNTHVT